MISIGLKIPVLPGPHGGTIIVPGTEPSSSLTSTTLEAELRKMGMPIPSIITLNDALDAIPGSRVLLLDNFGTQTQKLFVLPETGVNCPPYNMEDWYSILRAAGRQATEDELQELNSKGCDILEGYDQLYGG